MTQPTYHVRVDGTCVITEYQHAPEFASFFPGIAGLWGRPLWVFYVNRGQAIASVGLRDKDHPILEFQPANRAYRLTPTHGFRTFIKRRQARRWLSYEPFAPHDPDAVQQMQITSSALQLEVSHRRHKLHVCVDYFTLPNEPIAALVRRLRVTNLSRSRQHLELLDGLPVIVPFGMSEWFLKHMSRTIEAWVSVTNADSRAPVFRLKVEPHDRPEVVPIREGNFVAAWRRRDQHLQPLPVIADPRVIFGVANDLAQPEAFWRASLFRVPAKPAAMNQMPAAMSFLRAELARGETLQIVSLIGHTRSEQELNAYLPRVTAAFVDRKAEENRHVIERLQDQVLTVTASPLLDRYVAQTWLDNGLRGGFPVSLGAPENTVTLYLYGRKHGDLERDYNQFALEPTPCSQGNANFRDIVQNRRSDGWIAPDAAARNVITFANLLQLDGFNPLVYTGTRFRTHAHGERTPGELAEGLSAPDDAALARLLSQAERVETAEHGEGFWSDHWIYLLDLLENYQTLYPEAWRTLLWRERQCLWFDNAYVVAPRSEKYVRRGGQVRQLSAVRRDEEKAEQRGARADGSCWMRIQRGRGEVYRSSLFVKLLIVALNKLASLDPAGVGIEMEADKPDWYDALNGLPALFGSSVSETFELIRWLRWLQTAVDTSGAEVSCVVPREAAELLDRLQQALQAFPDSSAQDRDLRYWDEATSAKEAYRAAVRLGINGEERALDADALRAFLVLALRRLDDAPTKAWDRTAKMYRTYFWHEPTEHEVLDAAPDGSQRIRVRAVRRHALPFFLEGNVHAMRVGDPAQVRALHRAVTRSRLYDRRLGMYKVTESLERAPLEIGRARIFTRGWLEHESVWLHMEYKYLLELLRAGCAKEFWAAFKRAGIPFQPPRRYGRSPLEHSSFIVSSAHPDPTLHGRGFVARLTGSTAEFLEMWRLMMAGKAPFELTGGGQLTFQPQPMLPAWLFTRRPVTVTFSRRSGQTETLTLPKDTVSVLLFGEALVTYYNPARRDTFGPRAVAPQVVRALIEDRWLEWSDGTIPAPYAARLRAGEIPRLEIILS